MTPDLPRLISKLKSAPQKVGSFTRGDPNPLDEFCPMMTGEERDWLVRLLQGNHMITAIDQDSARIEALEAQLAEANDRVHYAEGTAALAMKHRDDAESALAAARRAREWLPIETAPKDGTRVLVADIDIWMTCARFLPCNQYWIEDAASGLKLNDPTHWKPAPSPPSTETSIRKDAFDLKDQEYD